jgi:hypothetical protein
MGTAGLRTRTDHQRQSEDQVPANDNLITDWCQRNKFPGRVASEDPFRSLRDDLDRAIDELSAAIAEALEALDSFDREIIHDLEALQELHANVRTAIDDGFREFHYQSAQAWRRFREARATR